ncbi:response regulator [Mesorhizobium sp. BAC0120]|uniref:response regulator n=1 Tax=Mesorhizobium sp. BAC0120 TaxID=3090670 RepID=UPI00298C3F2B|nr:response regulator [Mesorhizobium sp. BAC0120]MDW6023606.1 response regulator [Mesorhizobium sp. BAC0120]
MVAGAKLLNGLRALVVEDESLLALSLEDDLISAGCSIVGPFGSLSSATEALRTNQFDLAILDVNLNGEMVFPLADELAGRAIPFVLLTGYLSTDLPERFRKVPQVTKPYDQASLIEAVSQAISKTETTAGKR